MNGVKLVQENRALFLVEDGDVLAAFKRWVLSNTALLKLDPINDESVLDELRLRAGMDFDPEAFFHVEAARL